MINESTCATIQTLDYSVNARQYSDSLLSCIQLEMLIQTLVHVQQLREKIVGDDIIFCFF